VAAARPLWWQIDSFEINVARTVPGIKSLVACVPFFERLGRIACAANDDEITHHKHDAVSIFYDLDAATMILV